MNKFRLNILLVFVFTGFFANAGELDGICALKNTAQTCKVVNKTNKTITQINWILEGSDADYGDEVLMNLQPEEEITIENEGEDNCLFTEWTWITAYTKNTIIEFGIEDSKDPYINFDEQDNCTITLK